MSFIMQCTLLLMWLINGVELNTRQEN